jgi:hypothetical protein
LFICIFHRIRAGYEGRGYVLKFAAVLNIKPLRGLVVLGLVLVLVFVSAAAQAPARAVLDFSVFQAPSEAQRRFGAVPVSWVVRADASSFCALVPDKSGFVSRPASCVWWRLQPARCTVVTTEETSHSELGFLFLHCMQSDK